MIVFVTIEWATSSICCWGSRTRVKALVPYPTSVCQKMLFLWTGFSSWWSQKEDCIGIPHWWLLPLCFVDVDQLGSLETKQNEWVWGQPHLCLPYTGSVEMGQNLICLSWPFSSSLSHPLNLYSVLVNAGKRNPVYNWSFQSQSPVHEIFVQTITGPSLL